MLAVAVAAVVAEGGRSGGVRIRSVDAVSGGVAVVIGAAFGGSRCGLVGDVGRGVVTRGAVWVFGADLGLATVVGGVVGGVVAGTVIDVDGVVGVADAL